MRDNIKEIQDEMNAIPCIFCGKQHHVELGGKDSCVSYDFSKDSCEKFIERVKAIVSIKCAGSDFMFP